jgi:hypothetical protein
VERSLAAPTRAGMLYRASGSAISVRSWAVRSGQS